MLRGHPSRRLLICALTLGAITLVGAGQASAGYGVAPANGQTFPVTVDSSNAIESPRTIDLVVYLDTQDSAPHVWLSDSPAIDGSGTPAGGSVGGCSVSTLIPFGEQNKWVCRAPTQLLEPGKTYYWWLDFKRQDPGATVATDRISGPFSFTLSDAERPQKPEGPIVDPHTGVSTKTVGSAATLPGSSRYNGSRSIKHTVLTTLVYRTMKSLGMPRQLAFACWNRSDWLSVLAAEGTTPTRGDSMLLGFWLGRQPRWLHLAPSVCADVQGLLSSKRPNAPRAGALSTVIHETLHAYGLRNEAQTNCFAVQLVPIFGVNMGMPRSRATYMGTLARNFVRMYAPSGYWNRLNCRDGGVWDLFPALNLS